MTSADIREIIEQLEKCTEAQRRAVFDQLRREFPIHEFEKTIGVSAETILEAISRAPDITQRGVRGVIAEAIFKAEVIPKLVSRGWKDIPIQGDRPFDFEIADTTGHVRIQIKLQRKEKQAPKVEGDFFVVETQRTRGGTKKAEGQGVADEAEKTRPYRFGEFDILAVCMEPSTKNWTSFMYTLESWLIPRTDNATCVNTFQYVPAIPNDDWTADLLTALAWLRSDTKRMIQGKGNPNTPVSLFPGKRSKRMSQQ